MMVTAEQVHFGSSDRKVVDPEPFLETLGVRTEYTLDGTPVYCKAPYVHIHALVHTSLSEQIHLTRLKH